jgi:hypothetical protein
VFPKVTMAWQKWPQKMPTKKKGSEIFRCQESTQTASTGLKLHWLRSRLWEQAAFRWHLRTKFWVRTLDTPSLLGVVLDVFISCVPYSGCFIVKGVELIWVSLKMNQKLTIPLKNIPLFISD